MTFREPLVTSVKYKHRRYTLKPSFDHVIAAYKILEDERLTESERVDVALFYLIDGKYPVDYGLLITIFDALKALPKASGDDGDPVTDFDYDAPYIYASFMQAYGIDLYEQRGILHWQKFCALFASLPQDTRISEIINIRTRPVPEGNPHNRKEIESLMRAKALYRLPVKNPEKKFEDGLRKMVLSLRK